MGVILALRLLASSVGSEAEPVEEPVAQVEQVEGPGIPAWVWARVACIEAKESGGANVANRRGSGAGGVMQYLPGTFARGARELGHPEWSLWVPWQARTVAAHDLLLGRRAQWTVSGC